MTSVELYDGLDWDRPDTWPRIPALVGAVMSIVRCDPRCRLGAERRETADGIAFAIQHQRDGDTEHVTVTARETTQAGVRATVTAALEPLRLQHESVKVSP